MDLSINLSTFPTPKTYIRYGIQTYIDPFRQMLVPQTPESILLYKMEMYVHKTMGVPKNRMLIQQSLRKFGINSTKVVSIVIQDVIDGHLAPIAIVDCATPGNPLSFVPIGHLEEFAKARNINYIVVTNGTEVDSYISRADRLSFWKIDNVPNYQTIQEGHHQMLATAPAITPDSDLVGAKAKAKANAKFNGKSNAKTQGTLPQKPMLPPTNRPAPPADMHPLILQIEEALKASKNKLTAQSYSGVQLVMDCGKRKKNTKATLTPVEASVQRTFLIEDFHKNHQLMAVDIEYDTHMSGNPSIAVTLDHFEHRQTIFNLDFNADIKISALESETPAYACHLDLNIAFESSGSDFVTGLIGEIKKHLEQADLQETTQLKMIGPNQLYLGTLSNKDSHQLTQFLMTLMALALIIDEYRETLKRRRKR